MVAEEEKEAEEDDKQFYAGPKRPGHKRGDPGGEQSKRPLHFTLHIDMGFEPTQGWGEVGVALDKATPPACGSLGLQAFDAPSHLTGK
jgi:hypothetical protein